MDICGKDALWIPEGNCECPEGGGPAITKVLHSQLVALQQANMLEPGMQYRIIDYECTTTQEGTDVVQHPFDIVVVADDENTLNENARAMLRDGDVYYASTDIDAWELKYTVDNDQSRFGWADPVNGKGVVYYMKDEFDNVAPYDFKQIVFERYEILDVLSELVDLSSMEHNFISMNAAKGGDTPGPVRSAKGEKKAPVKTTAKESAKATVLRAADGQAVGMFVLPYLPVYAFTFSNIADGVITDASVGQYDLCRNNTIGQSIEQQYDPHYILPDNVFINRSDDIGGVVYEGNVIGINSEGNTFGSGAFYNAIGDGCSFITAANALSDTTIGNSVAEVCLGVVCQGNVIGENSHEVYIDEYSYRNQIGADCTNIIIGSGDYDNHIGNHCSDILLGNASSINSIGDTCSNITILEDTLNKVGAGCYDIYLDRAEANTFGTLCTGFYLQRGSGHNTFGNTCHDITLGEYVQHSTFEDNVAYISIGDLFSDLTFETGVQYVTLPGINSGVYRYYFLTGTKGTAADPITFTPVAAPYTRYVGLNSQGNLEIWNPADGGVPVGAPVIVNSVSAMTDTSKIYLYTGSEAGYTAGDWYYWDGAAWVSGGVYGGSSVVIDNTLTRTGEAADAKVTGDRLAALASDIAHVESSTTATQNYAVGDYVIVNNQLYQVTAAIPTSGTITPGTNVVSISVDEVLKDLEERKADKDGTYEDMTVGNAEQLVATVYTEDKVPYNFRTSGGSADIGDREEDTVVGGTIAWNQLLPNGDFSNGITGWGYQGYGLSYAISNNVFTYTVTDNTQTARPNLWISQATVPPMPGHKYLASVDIKLTSSAPTVQKFGFLFGNVFFNTDNNIPRGVWKTEASILPVTSASSYEFTLYFNYNITYLDNNDTMQYRNVVLFDLTQMFGPTIADYLYSIETSTPGSGVAWFKSLFPKSYYAYNAGELMSVNAVSHDMVGFNQWDEEWQSGNWKDADGSWYVPSTPYLCNKNPIPVFPNTTYYSTAVIRKFFYDADGNYIEYGANSSGAFTTPANCYYLNFRANDYTSPTTYNHNICINLAHNGTRNGQYEPYEKRTYALADITLRGIPKLDSSNQLYYDGDVYESSGKVTRKYGVVTLNGSEAGWLKSGGALNGYYIPEFTMKNNSPIIATGFIYTGISSVYKNNYGYCYTDYTIAFSVDPAIYGSTIESFKAYLSTHPITVIYELQTPTEESATPYQNPQIVDDWGTEEYVDGDYTDGTRDVAVPVGHITKYPTNLRDKLQHLPDLASSDGTYVIAQSGSNMVLTPLITPTELPTAPSIDGTYRLIVTVSGGNVTYSWVTN